MMGMDMMTLAELLKGGAGSAQKMFGGMPGYISQMNKPQGGGGTLGTKLQKQLFWDGLHIKFTGDSGIIAPQFVAEEKHIDEMVDKLRATLSKI